MPGEVRELVKFSVGMVSTKLAWSYRASLRTQSVATIELQASLAARERLGHHALGLIPKRRLQVGGRLRDKISK